MSARISVRSSSSCSEEILESEEDFQESFDYGDDFEQDEFVDEEDNRREDDNIQNDDNFSKKTREKFSKQTENGSRAKLDPAILSQNYPRGCSLSKKPQSQGQNRSASQTSSGSRRFSLASKTGMCGSSRTESLMSSIGIMSQRKKTSHLQQRLNSARRKSQNELVNRIGSMKIRIQDLVEENRTLKTFNSRKEVELDRLLGKEGDLPVILKAHNEEIRVLKIKMKQAQESNKKLSNRLKEKNIQVIDLQEDNKELKRRNKDDGHDDKYDLREQLEEVTRNLKERDTEFKSLLHRQDVLEKSHKQQLITEIRKKKAMTAELQKAKLKIEELDDVLKEKDKIINRLHIYSRRHQQNVKHSASTGNLSLFDEESVVTRLDNKLKEFANKKNNSSNSESKFDINSESVEVLPKEKRNDMKSKDTLIENDDCKLQNQYDKVVDRQLSSNEKVKRLSSAARRHKTIEQDTEKNVKHNSDIMKEEILERNHKADDLLKKDVYEGKEEVDKEASSYESEESAQYTEPETESSSSEESGESTPVSSHRPASSKQPTVNENGVKTSFQSKRKFFEELGPIKVKELKPKVIDTVKDEESSKDRVMSPMEKVSLWLPATQPKASIIDEKKKLNLISQLNAIDDGRGSPYNPSFNSGSKELNGISNPSPDSYPPAHSNGYVSEQSKLGKKANLMTELFGDAATNSEISNNFDSQGSRLLKTSLKTSQNSGKSVKFYEKED